LLFLRVKFLLSTLLSNALIPCSSLIRDFFWGRLATSSTALVIYHRMVVNGELEGVRKASVESCFNSLS
jgi:hypothetical protein